jgi:hypothetical protein
MEHEVSVVFKFQVNDQADKDYLDGAGFLADLLDVLPDLNLTVLSVNNKTQDQIREILQAELPK